MYNPYCNYIIVYVLIIFENLHLQMHFSPEVIVKLKYKVYKM